MNKTLTTIVFATYLTFSILVIILNFGGLITFGYGLGDLVYMFLVAILLAIVTTLKVLGRRIEELNWVVIFAAIVIMIFIILMITVCRGAEYSWDGHIFI